MNKAGLKRTKNEQNGTLAEQKSSRQNEDSPFDYVMPAKCGKVIIDHKADRDWLRQTKISRISSGYCEPEQLYSGDRVVDGRLAFQRKMDKIKNFITKLRHGNV